VKVRPKTEASTVASSKLTGVLQRKCACGGAPGPTGECESCRKKHEAKEGTLQRKASNAEAASEVPPIVHEVLQSPGQPLEPDARGFMESRFGHDFSSVRVHTDSRAAKSAQAVNALAYTVGNNVVFDAGQHAPNSGAGRKLVAHELAHVVQQSGSAPSGPLQLGLPANSAELEAERMASEVTHPSHTMAPTAFSAQPQQLSRNLRPNVIDEVSTKLKETLVTGKGKTQDYEWTANYSVYMYENSIVIEVRIKLKGKVSEQTKKAWLEGINAKWNNKFQFNNGKRKVSLDFWAVFTDLNPHVEVDVVNKPKSSGDWDRRHWDAGDSEGDTQGDAAAHEFGHMIGNKDEYNLPDGKGGKKSLDGVMSHAAQEAKERHFTQFLNWLNAHRNAKEPEFKLEKIK
jgi:hypothetical protein